MTELTRQVTRSRTFPVVEIGDVPDSSRDRVRRWVSAYGVNRVSLSLGIERRNVHQWTQKVRPITPLPQVVRKIIALSTVEPHGVGPLTYEDFFGPIEIKAHSQREFGRPRFVPMRRAV